MPDFFYADNIGKYREKKDNSLIINVFTEGLFDFVKVIY